MIELLNILGTSVESYKNLLDAGKFVQTVMYSGKENESIEHTRARIYEKQKTKSSASLIPDPSSLESISSTQIFSFWYGVNASSKILYTQTQKKEGGRTPIKVWYHSGSVALN